MTIEEMNIVINNRVKEIITTENVLMDKIKNKPEDEQKEIIHDLALHSLLYGNK